MNCQNCTLARPGIRPVPGAGKSPNKYFFIGEAPGWHENVQGVPFVGAAGEFFNELLGQAGIPRSQVYVTNVAKCMPPKDARGKQKKPTKKQQRACSDMWLWEEIARVDPEVIVTLGATPLGLLLPGESVSECHGQVFDMSKNELHAYPGTRKLIAMYHPAASLHQPQLRGIVVNDFKNLKTRLEGGVEQEAPKVKTITTYREWHDLLTKMSMLGDSPNRPMVAFDFETTDLRTHLAEAVGLALSFRHDGGEIQSFYLPLQGVIPYDDGDIIDTATLVHETLHNVAVGAQFVAHNAKYELGILETLMVQAPQDVPVHCTLVLAALLNKPNKGLKALALQLFGYKMTNIEELIGKGKGQITMAEVPVETVAPYAGADTHFTLLLWEKLSQEMDEELWTVYRGIEQPLLSVVAKMEREGAALDSEAVTTAQEELHILHEKAVAGLREKVKDPEYNPNSPPQTLRLLQGRGLKITNTEAPTLHMAAVQEPLCLDIIQARHLSKLSTSYASGLEKMLPRAYGSVNPTGTGTGRFSYSGWKVRGEQWGINLQTIPKPKMWEDVADAESNLIRRCFVADPGTVFVELDYSQIELRVAAHISQDPAMIAAYIAGADIHEEMEDLAGLRSIMPEAEPDSVRRVAKVLNFGVLYEPEDNSATGVVLRTCAEAGVRLTRSRASALVRARRSAFPGIVDYYDAIRYQLRTKGYVQTEMGRRLYLPWLSGEGRAVEKSNATTLRQAVNMPIQGTSADMVKMALVRLHHQTIPYVHLVWTVHDSILLRTEPQNAGAVALWAKRHMESVLALRVPVIVDAKVGENLAEMEKLEV